MKTIFKLQQGKIVTSIPVTLEEDGQFYNIFTQYHPQMIQELKAMDGARWEPVGKFWRVRNNERNNYSIQCLETNSQLFNSSIQQRTTTPKRNLFRHQQEALNFAWSRKRCLLALEMGLGKTLTAIELIEKVIIEENKLNWWLVAPYGAQQTWKYQLLYWQAKFKFVVISTYESLHHWMKALSDDLIPDGVIFDESIKIKNNSAQRSQVASELCRLVRGNDGYIIELSGAPSPKNPIDWWHQIEVLQPGFIREGNPRKFMLRYANVKKVDHGYGEHLEIESWKEDELVKLGQRLAPIVLVKKKKDCLDLPDKIFEERQCDVPEELMRQAFVVAELAENGIGALEKLRELSDGFQYTRGEIDSSEVERRYLACDSNNRNDVKVDSPSNRGTTGNDSVFDETNREVRSSRQTIFSSINPKLEVVKELLDLYHVDNGGPGRLVIYAVYHGAIDLLIKFCESNNWISASIDGRGWSNKAILEDFDNNNNSNICIIAHPGSVYGLNLQRTYCLCYYSNSFNVDHRIQSLDRRDRPGMDINKGTRIVDILCLPTDKYILEKLKLGMSIQDITLEEIKKRLSTK